VSIAPANGIEICYESFGLDVGLSSELDGIEYTIERGAWPQLIDAIIGVARRAAVTS